MNLPVYRSTTFAASRSRWVFRRPLNERASIPRIHLDVPPRPAGHLVSRYGRLRDEYLRVRSDLQRLMPDRSLGESVAQIKEDVDAHVIYIKVALSTLERFEQKMEKEPD